MESQKEVSGSQSNPPFQVDGKYIALLWHHLRCIGSSSFESSGFDFKTGFSSIRETLKSGILYNLLKEHPEVVCKYFYPQEK